MLYTKQEFIDLKGIVDGIKDWIPENQAGYIWNNYRRVVGNNENQPCNCGSSAKHWKKAVDTLRIYVKENSEVYNNI